MLRVDSSLILGVLISLFFLSVTFFKGGYALFGSLVFVFSSAYIFFKRDSLFISKEDFLFISGISLPVVVSVCLAWIFSDNLSFPHYDLRVLLFLPIFLAVMKIQPNKKIIILGLVCGLLSASVFACYLFYERPHRIGVHINNEIVYAQIIALQCVTCTVFLFNQEHKWEFRFLCLISLGLGLYTLALTQTRGAFVGFYLGITAVFFIYLYKKYDAWKATLLSLSPVLLIIPLIYLTREHSIWVRFDEAYMNFFEYLHSGQILQSDLTTPTPTGARMELWCAAIKVWSKGDMVVGEGIGSFGDQLLSMIASGDINAAVGVFGHAHNQFLHTLAERGLVGLILLLISFLVPLYLFFTRFKDSSSSLFALAGVAIIVTTVFSSMTQVLFAHNQSLISYWMFLCVFWYLSSDSVGSMAKNDSEL